MDIGERIKAIRKEKKLTQQDIANALGVQSSAVSKYEKGIVSPSWETLEKIAAVFDMTIEDLLYNVNALSYDDNLRNSVEQSMQMLVDELPKTKLLAEFDKLNKAGKNEAVKRTAELAKLPEYIKPDEE